MYTYIYGYEAKPPNSKNEEKRKVVPIIICIDLFLTVLNKPQFEHTSRTESPVMDCEEKPAPPPEETRVLSFCTFASS